MMRKLSGMKDREKKTLCMSIWTNNIIMFFFDESNFKRKLHGNCQSIVLSTKTAELFIEMSY